MQLVLTPSSATGPFPDNYNTTVSDEDINHRQGYSYAPEIINHQGPSYLLTSTPEGATAYRAATTTDIANNLEEQQTLEHNMSSDPFHYCVDGLTIDCDEPQPGYVLEMPVGTVNSVLGQSLYSGQHYWSELGDRLYGMGNHATLSGNQESTGGWHDGTIGTSPGGPEGEALSGEAELFQ